MNGEQPVKGTAAAPGSAVDALRPPDLESFSGQPATTEELRIVLGAARHRGQMPDHILFSGPPGLGKTSLAHIVATEIGVPLVSTSGPLLERPSDVAQLLSTLRGPSVVFIDEIHRVPLAAEEILYSAMEDGVLELKVGERAAARVVQVRISPFCLVGATTKAGMVSPPLLTRFGFNGRLNPYEAGDLAGIIERSAALLDVTITTDAAVELASRSRGTPRIANRWLRRTRDWVQTRPDIEPDAGVHIDLDAVRSALAVFGVDELGLDRLGRDYLRVLCTQFGGGPTGLTTLAAAIGDTPETVSEVIEPHLLHSGLIARTPQGRRATGAAYEHLGLSVPAGADQDPGT